MKGEETNTIPHYTLCAPLALLCGCILWRGSDELSLSTNVTQSQTKGPVVLQIEAAPPGLSAAAPRLTRVRQQKLCFTKALEVPRALLRARRALPAHEWKEVIAQAHCGELRSAATWKRFSWVLRYTIRHSIQFSAPRSTKGSRRVSTRALELNTQLPSGSARPQAPLRQWRR